MRILSSMEGDQSSNPVIAYQDEYYENHPLDTSFTGTLARISGQSKDDIAFLLELTRYSDQIAKYNPSTRYAFGGRKKEPEYQIETQESLPTFTSIISRVEPIFTDRRNYAV